MGYFLKKLEVKKIAREIRRKEKISHAKALDIVAKDLVGEYWASFSYLGRGLTKKKHKNRSLRDDLEN